MGERLKRQRMQQVMNMRMSGASFAQIAAQIGRSRQRAQQIFRQAVQRARQKAIGH